jgi:hypothetical protein
MEFWWGSHVGVMIDDVIYVFIGGSGSLFVVASRDMSTFLLCS